MPLAELWCCRGCVPAATCGGYTDERTQYMPVVKQGGVYCIQVKTVSRYCRVRTLTVTVEYLRIDRPSKVYLLPRAGGRAPGHENEKVCGLLMLE